MLQMLQSRWGGHIFLPSAPSGCLFLPFPSARPGVSIPSPQEPESCDPMVCLWMAERKTNEAQKQVMRAEEMVLVLLWPWPASSRMPWQLQALPAQAAPAASAPPLSCKVPAFYWVWPPSRISLRNATARRETAVFNTSYFSPNGVKLQWSKNTEAEHLCKLRAACSPNTTIPMPAS